MGGRRVKFLFIDWILIQPTGYRSCGNESILLNKIGDLFLIAGITLLLLVTDTISFDMIFLCAAHMPFYLLEIISALLVVGAVGQMLSVPMHFLRIAGMFGVCMIILQSVRL